MGCVRSARDLPNVFIASIGWVPSSRSTVTGSEPGSCLKSLKPTKCLNVSAFVRSVTGVARTADQNVSLTKVWGPADQPSPGELIVTCDVTGGLQDTFG